MASNSTSLPRDSARFSMMNIFQAVKDQDRSKGDLLAQNQAMLHELKKEISMTTKKNYTLEKDIRSLDQKIGLLIRNRISLEEVLKTSSDMSEMYKNENNQTTTLSSQTQTKLYGQLFSLLQRKTDYLARLTKLVKLGEIDNLLQTVMFTLYGNQYEPREEHLLLSMFKQVLQKEFEEATDLGSLLRANTAITRMMTTYTRRGPGQTYLKNVLALVLKPIFDSDLDLEINPVKVYDKMIQEMEDKGQTLTKAKQVDSEQAAKDADVIAIIKPRLKKLDELARHVVSGIIKSIDDVPYGIRWICQQIRQLMRQKFPQATREQTCSLIGGFFLLRFVNPAVVTPQAFMMVETKLSPKTRRNLTLIAKLMQNLANNSAFGEKEAFMAPLNEFLKDSKSKMNDFLEQLTRVQSLDERLQMDQYLELTKRNDNIIHISLNEMYSCHRLLREHIDIVCPQPNDQLRGFLNALGQAPDNVPRKESLVVDLQLMEERDSDIGARPEQLYAETKWLLFTILRSIPSLDQNADIKTNLRAAKQFAQTKQNQTLADRVQKCVMNLHRLTKDGVINEDDNFAQLRRDIIQETLEYERQIEKTTTDLRMLRGVYRDLMEHHDFLQQQFVAYKQYLGNVRAGAATSKKTKNLQVTQNNNAAPVETQRRFQHAQWEKDGIIVSSEVPAERRPQIELVLAQPLTGVFCIAVMYRNRQISEMRVKLDDLLEKKHKGESEIETEFMKFNVNLLLLLLCNKTFLT